MKVELNVFDCTLIKCALKTMINNTDSKILKEGYEEAINKIENAVKEYLS